MHISVFCGASLPHSEQITEAARQLGRAIGNSMANAKQDFEGLAKTKHLKE